jgi:hypothetical protein
MLRRAALVLLLFLCASAALGQATATDSQTLQAMLAEIHQLRQDLQTSAIAARRAQILIYRLHLQETVVAQVIQRLDAAKSYVEQLRNQRRYHESRIKENEEWKDQAQTDDQRTQFENTIAELKAQMETFGPAEQEAQTTQLEIEEQARIEQAKLNRLENELDELDRAVMTTALRQDPTQRPSTKSQ